MFRLSRRVVPNYWFVWLLFSLVANFTWAQSETATVSGQVVDPSGLNITGAQVKLVDIDHDTGAGATTNNSGLYTFPSVRPGRYRMAVTAAGFKVVNVTGVTVNVQDHLEQNFKLVVGSVSESITVEGGAPLVDAESAAVGTVVDRQFAENLPLNGRSFQTLIQLTPGVVLTSGVELLDGGWRECQHWSISICYCWKRARAIRLVWRIRCFWRHEQSGFGRCFTGVSHPDLYICSGIRPYTRRTDFHRNTLWREPVSRHSV